MALMTIGSSIAKRIYPALAICALLFNSVVLSPAAAFAALDADGGEDTLSIDV
jgi:hypothetical protein